MCTLSARLGGVQEEKSSLKGSFKLLFASDLLSSNFLFLLPAMSIAPEEFAEWVLQELPDGGEEGLQWRCPEKQQV